MTGARHRTTHVVRISPRAFKKKKDGKQNSSKHKFEQILQSKKITLKVSLVLGDYTKCYTKLHHTNDWRVSDSPNHFISDPSGWCCTCNIAGTVHSNCPDSVMGPKMSEKHMELFTNSNSVQVILKILCAQNLLERKYPLHSLHSKQSLHAPPSL